jgi:hypothetical protein
MPRSAPIPNATHDRLLVFAMGALVLGVVMVSQGVLLGRPMTDLLPSEHAALMPAGRPLLAQDQRLATASSPTDRIPPTPAALMVVSAATTPVAACPPHFDFDHDPRLVLSVMGLQRRGFTLERPVAPNKQDASIQYPVLARAVVTVLRAEASPQAVEPPTDDGALQPDPSRDCAISLQPPTDATTTEAGLAHVGATASAHVGMPPVSLGSGINSADLQHPVRRGRSCRRTPADSAHEAVLPPCRNAYARQGEDISIAVYPAPARTVG